MTDKLKLIDAEILACKSKMGALVGEGGVVLRAGPKPLEKIIVDAEAYTIMIAGSKTVEVKWLNAISEDDKKKQFDYITAAPMFVDWCFNFDKEFLAKIEFQKIILHNIDMKAPPNVLFIKFSTDMKYNTGFVKQFREDARDEKIPAPFINSIVFMRGGSVAILVILNCENRQKYSILTLQPRVPVGKSILEIPAGMLDGSSDFAGVAATELRQEANIDIKQNELENLLNPIDFEDSIAAYPSPGGCDETMRFYLYEPTKLFSFKEISEMQGKMTGEFQEGEVIHLKIVTLEELRENIIDMKTMTALYLYDRFMAKLDKIPDGHTKRNNEKRDKRLENLKLSMVTLEKEIQQIQKRKEKLGDEHNKLTSPYRRINDFMIGKSNLLISKIKEKKAGGMMTPTEILILIDSAARECGNSIEGVKRDQSYIIGAMCAILVKVLNEKKPDYYLIAIKRITETAEDLNETSKQAFKEFVKSDR